MENEWFPRKLNVLLPCSPAIVLIGSYPEEFTAIVHTNKNLHLDVYSVFIYNWQNLEEIKVPFN